MNRNFTSLTASIFGLLTFIWVGLAIVFAYLTHVYWTITMAMTEQLDTAGEMFLAIVGLLVPPLGTIHGIILWFM